MSGKMQNGADEATFVDAVEKIKALIFAANAGESAEVREHLAQEAAFAHVLAISAGTQFNGVGSDSAVVTNAMQIAVKGALQVAATCLCEKRGEI